VPPWLRRLFARTGTLHILAISGLHVGILYFALRIMLKILRCNRTLSVVLSVFALIFFALLTGARPPIVRATVMFCILAASELLRRKVGILNVVGLSCLGMLFVNPCQVFDVGFIFSYTAVVSIIILSPGLQSALMARGTFGPDRAAYRKAYFALARSLSVSLGAWIGLLPLIAYYFGMITPVIVIANLFAVPLVALVMGSGLIFLLFGSFLRFCAPLFAQSTWFFIFVLTDGLKFLGRIPFGSFTVPHWSRSGVCVYYASILLIICVARVKKLTICFLT
jgi:competence protein ComEC